MVANDDSLPASNNYNLIGKLVGFVVNGMPLAGEPVSIVISQSMSIPANAVYRQYITSLYIGCVTQVSPFTARGSERF